MVKRGKKAELDEYGAETTADDAVVSAAGDLVDDSDAESDASDA